MQTQTRTRSALLALAFVLSACAGVALTPADKEGSLEIQISGDPHWLVIPEGFVAESDKANYDELQKAVLKHKINTSKVFLEALSKELKQAGVFRTVVSEGGALKTRFNNLRVTYSDGDVSQTLPIYADAWLGVQIVRSDGTGAWSGMVNSGTEGARKEKLEDLVASKQALTGFFEDLGRRMGAALAKRLGGQ